MTAAPARRLVVPFTKMTGAGNDFVVVDNRWFHFTEAELAALAARVGPRRVGVGADGLLALEAPDGMADSTAGGAHFRMRYRNADGSRATMCGNGARCLARFAARAGLGDAGPDDTVALTFDTDGGRYRALVPPTGDVTLHVPPPRDFVPDALADAAGPVHRLWTGTEHVVLFVEGAAAADVDTVGRRLRHHAAFAPAGTNVNVVEIADAGDGGEARVVARTFEKGVEGETLACGTGAVAAAVVARLTGRVRADRVAVAMPGGTLTVGFRVEPAPDPRLRGEARGEAVADVTLAGPAEAVYEGTLEV